MGKRKSRLLILLSVIVALILCVGVFCACEKDDITYSVMLPSGEHYTVTSDNIVKASRGARVVFDVNIEDGYALYSTSSGAYADNKLVVDDVKYDMTIIFDVRKKANITYDTPNAKVEITPIANTELIVGEKATMSAVANENYNIESLTINGVAIDVAAIGSIPSKVVEIVLEENMLVEAETLGDEYAFTIECDANRCTYTVERDSKDEKYRYGDNVTIKTQAIAPNYFGYYNYNGQLITENKPLQFTINGATGVKIQFYNEFENRIIYNANGGIITDNAFSKIFYTEGEYVNIDHCYNKITRDGYSLVGLREGQGGEVHRLGAMAKIPKANLELYAIWEEWTDSSYFLSEAIDEKTCRIVGYTPNIGTNSLARLVIPEIIGGRKVVEISANAFKDNQYLQEVVFSKNTVTVGDNAFANCPSLSKIMIFESMTSKAVSAFANCPKFTTCAINATSDADNHDNYHTMQAQQFNRLRDKGRKKSIIIVSGSSGALGLNSQEFNTQFPEYDIINMGISKGVTGRYMLELIFDNTIASDIVVLSQEFTWDMYMHCESVNSITFTTLQKNYDISNCISVKNNSQLFNKLNNLFSGKVPGGVFRPAFNNLQVSKNGILDAERGCLGTGFYDINIDSGMISSDLNIALDLAKNIQQNKGVMYVSFPPTASSALVGAGREASNRKDFENKYRAFYSRDILVPVISDINKYLFEDKYFYDSPYHLTFEGSVFRSAQLCKDIKAQLAKEGK